jgi:hypothetical protein
VSEEGELKVDAEENSDGYVPPTRDEDRIGVQLRADAERVEREDFATALCMMHKDLPMKLPTDSRYPFINLHGEGVLKYISQPMIDAAARMFIRGLDDFRGQNLPKFYLDRLAEGAPVFYGIVDLIKVRSNLI